MTLAEEQSENGGHALETAADKLPTRADTLTYFWSVTLPRWLDPWAARLADSLADGAWTASCRGVAAIAPLLALTIGFLVPQVWPGMRTVYTESPLFMGLIIAGAILSGPVGVMMLLGHIAAILVWGSTGLPFMTRHQEWLDYFLRRGGSLLISYLLLAIPAIMVPQQARWMAEEAPLPSKAGAVNVGVRAVLYAFASGVLIYLWCQAMPALIRPVFTWLGMAPRVEAISPLQQGWPWLVAAAALAAIVRIVAESVVIGNSLRGSVVAALQEQRWAEPERRYEFWRQIPLLMRVSITSAVITLFFSGLYESGVDALLVGAVTLIFEVWRAGLIGRFPQWWERAVWKTPALLRFLIALVLGYLLSHWVVTRQWQGDTFRPVLWAAVLTLVIFYLLFPRHGAVQEEAVETKEFS